METAIFVSETKAILLGEAMENRFNDVDHCNVQRSVARGQMMGYKVKIVWTDGRWGYMTEAQVEALED